MTIKIVAFGGSNTFMELSYIHTTAFRLKQTHNEEVTLINNAVGNTFVHYGLYKSITSRSHVDADVVIIEFAVNDFEIQGAPGALWTEAFEGLLRRVTTDAPNALVATVIIAPRRFKRKARALSMWAHMSYLTERYGGIVVDFTDVSTSLFPERFSRSVSVYKDVSHLSPAFQVMLGDRLADAISKARFQPKRPRPPAHLSLCDLSSSTSAKQELFAAWSGTHTPLKNSRLSIDCIELSEGDELHVSINGSAMLLSYAATASDGIIKFTQGSRSVLISTMRRAITPNSRWPFLESNILVWQAMKSANIGGEKSENVSMRLLTRAEERRLKPTDVFFRGSTTMPLADVERKFHLADLLFYPNAASASDA